MICKLENTYYTSIFAVEREAGSSAAEAAIVAAKAYLGGRPRGARRPRIESRERDLAFSASPFLKELPAEAWLDDALVLALGRLIGQDRVAVGGLIEYVARDAPEAVRRAVRCSGLALRQGARHRPDVARLATRAPDEFSDFDHILCTIETQCRKGQEHVDALRQPFAGMSPLALLVYASLYAFRHVVVPKETTPPAREDQTKTEAFWRAVNRVFAWKLETTHPDDFRLTERDIGKCLRTHLSPWLFPDARAGTELMAAFEELLNAEYALQEAEHAAAVFCYSTTDEFVRGDDGIEFVGDIQAQAAWRRIDERLSRLHWYWLMRGITAFADSPLSSEVIGRAENHEWNRTAYVKAMATLLRLTEVYGVGATVTNGTGAEVPLFKALLARELVTAFGQTEFVLPFRAHLAQTGDWSAALSALAIGGLAGGLQNRLPMTFSRREDKIRNLVHWTVSKDRPRGSRPESKAIVDFWTSDWAKLADRLRRKEPGRVPELFERPFLKLGQYLFELPWVSALQNNQSAAINNLRRLGNRRTEILRETQHVEKNLATLFLRRGFRVRLNWQAGGAGEVDLVCARDGGVLVLEVKSTHMGGSLREAWLHGNALRRAGDQLRRKVPAVISGAEFSNGGQASSQMVHAWIVDTSIEHDHERFDGFLKVSMEELIIALRDDWAMLNEAEQVLAVDSHQGVETLPVEPAEKARGTLYPDGFSFGAFVDVVESESVWERR